MMNFSTAIRFVLHNEGGYNDTKADKGGATKYGISTRFLKQIDKDINKDGHVNKKDAQALTLPGAIDLYREYFWDHYKLGLIRDLAVVTKMLDLFVNFRGLTAGKIIQTACVAGGVVIKIDGIIGSRSVRAINSLSLFGVSKLQFLEDIRTEQAEIYKSIVKSNPTQKKFLKGWLLRASR